MYIPSQEQWQKVIDTIKSVLPRASSEANFNIGYGIVHGEPCGTICCVAGWYMVAKVSPEEAETLSNGHWIFGKDALAGDLGFKDGQYFKTWANENVELWGNRCGYNMFMDIYAYNSGAPGAYAKTLQDVINHFEFVKKQCYAYTNQTTVANSN